MSRQHSLKVNADLVLGLIHDTYIQVDINARQLMAELIKLPEYVSIYYVDIERHSGTIEYSICAVGWMNSSEEIRFYEEFMMGIEHLSWKLNQIILRYCME